MTLDPSPTPVIGLFGGSFNPPHMAHVLVVAWALAAGQVDGVWVIPTGGHPFGKDLAPFAARLAMCRRAFAWAGDRVRVLDVEQEDRVHYTIETIRRLAAEFPGHRWRWIMGSDTHAESGKWHAFEQIRVLAPPLVIPRQGTQAEAGALANFALPDLSSTLIRRHLAAGLPAEQVASLLPDGVLALIRQEALYQP